jgi:hypothetical protein
VAVERVDVGAVLNIAKHAMAAAGDSERIEIAQLGHAPGLRVGLRLRQEEEVIVAALTVRRGGAATDVGRSEGAASS